MSPFAEPAPGRPAAAGPREGESLLSSSQTDLERLLDLADLDIGVDAHGEALRRLEAARPAAAPGSEMRFAIERRIAFCLERLGRAQEALTTAGRALELAHPSLPAMERARCLIVASKASVELGQLPPARAYARTVLEILPSTTPANELGAAENLLGWVALRTGESEAARSHFERALEVYRKTGDLQMLAGAYVNLGLLHKLRCDWERAAEHYHVAYYLATTLGQAAVVMGAAQNLGILLAKTGQQREARSYFERGLKLAIENGDGVRQIRARLGLARLDRSDHWTARARALLDLCHADQAVTVPERERCLILLEEIRLDLEDGLLEHAGPRLADLRLRVEAMAPRGDLMVEILLAEADLASATGDWEEAARAAAGALDISRHDRDRAQEERAQARLAVAWAHTGRVGEAEAALAALLERHRARGEWPALASTLAEQGRILREVRGDHEAALRCFHEAAEVHRRLGFARSEALMTAEQAACLALLGRRDEALAHVAELRRRHPESEPFPRLEARLGRISESLHVEASGPGQRPDGLKVHERLEEILASSSGAWERLHEVLSILREALEVDGAFLARFQEGQLDILASIGVEAARGARSAILVQFRDEAAGLSGPKLVQDVDPRSPGRAGSRLWIPIELRGVPHVLFLRRNPAKGSGPMSRAESNYAMVLAAEIARALEIGSPHQEFADLAGGIALADVITQDARMLRILDLIRRVGDTDLSVLLQGETGTGKKLLAHAIHRASGRRGRPIVTVDCAALPESLLEAELFGYRKGAFTGAQQDRTGLLAEAAGGTVFLDEIDKSGLGVQRRFLHLLDSGEIRPVGSTSYVRLDVRIVCATSSPDLRQEVAEGRFLKDLYYRLNDISIQIPPLRERREDILLLAGCFVETFAAQTGRRIRGMSSSFRRRLVAHDWPGNVRELEKAIRRAITLADDDVLLTPDLLPREIVEVMEDTPEHTGEQLHDQVETFERRAIERALEVCEGNKSRAASLLGLSRKGLKGKIARYRIGTQAPPSGA